MDHAPYRLRARIREASRLRRRRLFRDDRGGDRSGFVARLRRGSRGARAPAPQATRVWMRNITIYPFDDAPTTIDQLSGTLTPTRAGRIVSMDDVTSYSVEVGHAEVRVPPGSLSAL